jgi:hypothetical protein
VPSVGGCLMSLQLGPKHLASSLKVHDAGTYHTDVHVMLTLFAS